MTEKLLSSNFVSTHSGLCRNLCQIILGSPLNSSVPKGSSVYLTSDLSQTEKVNVVTNEQMHKITSFLLKMVKAVILSVAQLAKSYVTIIFFSASDKSCVKWDNSQNSTQKTRTASLGRLQWCWNKFVVRHCVN